MSGESPMTPVSSVHGYATLDYEMEQQQIVTAAKIN